MFFLLLPEMYQLKEIGRMQSVYYIYIVWNFCVRGCGLAKLANHRGHTLIGLGTSAVFGIMTGTSGKRERDHCCGNTNEITNTNFHGDTPLIYATWLKGTSLYGDGECPTNSPQEAMTCLPA
jgi:hypothetical protein